MTTAVQSVPPLFIRDTDIGKTLTPFEMCSTIVRACSPSKLEGVQKINNIWRVYIKDANTRLELFMKEQIMIQGKNVPLYDVNPNHSSQQMYRGPPGTHVITQNDKLTIKHLPLSVSNEDIKTMLVDLGAELVSPIKYGFVRDEDGFLTQYKSGDRFVYVKPLDQLLPRHQKVGVFPCIVIHHGKEIKCSACGEKGHRVADRNCKAKPKKNILAFKSYEHPLSNHFPCELEVFDNKFKSVEEAYFWRMSLEMGKPDLAKKIHESRHAGEAKKISKDIADDLTRLQWETDNVDIMEHLLAVKAKQCERFNECLMETQDSVLAEATPSRFWGTGLSMFVTKNCSESYWPGQNMLGALLMDLRTEILTRKDESSSAQIDESLNGIPSAGAELSSDNSGELASGEGKMDEHTPSEIVTEDSLTHNTLQSAEELTVEMSTMDTSLETDMMNKETIDDDTLNKESTEEQRRARAREHVPHLFRKSRSLSESCRKSRSKWTDYGSSQGKKNDAKKIMKSKNEQMMTPRQTDIRKALGTKRIAEGSPEDKVDPKQQKQDNT